jgi:hypothetical protein
MGFSDNDDHPAPDEGLTRASAEKAVGKSRLAQALRANLNRRKAQSRARASGQAASGAALRSEADCRRD